jgi:uncharacterized protein YaaQ
MQLLFAIVQDEDADTLCERLNAQDFRVTRINTVGGFLARGNVTILAGVEDERVKDVLTTIGGICQTRRAFINAMPWGTEPVPSTLTTLAPLEVLVGGATVFSFPVRRFLRLQGGAAPPAADEKQPPAEPAEGASDMNLVLAIVQNEDADPVTQALLAAGHRVTRINTAGAFLRRGNATLLVGVEAEKVDNVLRLIQANCRLRAEASSPDSGMPMYSATVFVLESSHFVQI